MPRLPLLALLAACAVAAFLTGVPAACARAADPVRRPNVLFILCDDLRPDALGCFGSRHVKTPRIDGLAAGGVRFANAFCTTSLCSPSRASILTGLYAHAHGVRDNFTELPAGMPHWPGRLRAQGYATAYVGKWHMGEGNDAPRPGFDWFVSHRGQGKYFDTEWNVNGERREARPGYYTTVATDYCLEWLAARPEGQPWSLCLGHKAPHSFYFPEEKHAHAFDDVRVPYPPSAADLTGKPDWIRQRLPTWHGIHGPLFEWRKNFPDARPEAVQDFEKMVHAYWGTVLSVDESVGRLLDWLAARGQLDDTLVVFMGDNGLLEGEHGMVDKRTMHEPSIRIPVIARGPGLPAGRVVTAQVLTEDVAPSILDLAGAMPLPRTDGRSWRTLATVGDPAWRTEWLYEYDYERQFPYTPNVRGIRTDRHKFIRYPHGDGGPDRHAPELYDLAADPDERRNLAADPEHAATRADLERRLSALMAGFGLGWGRGAMPLDEGIKPDLPDQKIR
jgi:N-acetylglucosamine-6-sulfatase